MKVSWHAAFALKACGEACAADTNPTTTRVVATRKWVDRLIVDAAAIVTTNRPWQIGGCGIFL